MSFGIVIKYHSVKEYCSFINTESCMWWNLCECIFTFLTPITRSQRVRHLGAVCTNYSKSDVCLHSIAFFQLTGNKVFMTGLWSIKTTEPRLINLSVVVFLSYFYVNDHRIIANEIFSATDQCFNQYYTWCH